MKKTALVVFTVIVMTPILSSCVSTVSEKLSVLTEKVGVADSASSPAAPQNSAEREIFIQARLAGAAIGATAGAVVVNQLTDHSPIGTIAGGAAGAVVGDIVGRKIAEQQIYDLRDVKLKNEELKSLLTSAKEYNKSVQKYNDALKKEITGLKEKNKTERIEIAKSKKKEAEDYMASVNKSIEDRKKLSETLVSEQKSQYQKTLADLEKREIELDAQIKHLDKISQETVIVG